MIPVERKFPKLLPLCLFGSYVGGVMMNKRWTIEEIREYVKKNSTSELLSTEYKGFSQKLQFKCSCGNVFEKTLTKFKGSNQKSCTECAPIKPSR